MARTLPNLGLTAFFTLGEDGWDDEMSLNLLLLSVLTQGTVTSTVSATPGSPTNGDRHVFDGTHPTQPNKIAIRDNGAWVYITPLEGWLLWDQAANVYKFFDGTNWVNRYLTAGAAPGSEATDSEMWTGTTSAATVTPKKVFDAAVTQNLTDGASITIDGNTGLNFKVTLGGNRTLANPTNMKTGQSGVIIVTQDGTGSRTLAYGSNWKFPGGAATGGVLSTTANAVDVISYYVRSDGTILATLSKDFKS